MFMTIVMGLLIMAFALWGVGDYFNQSGSDDLATVNGQVISFNEYTTGFANYRQSMLQQFGEGFDPSYFDSPILRRNYLESMINSELLRQIANDNGFAVTAQELRETIEEAPAFKDENGNFDKSLYAAFLAQTNQSAQILQAKIAAEQAGQVVSSMFNQSSFVTPLEAKNMALLNNQTRSVEFINISTAKFIDTVEVTDEEITAYYESNSAEYMTEEMLSVNYVELKAEDVAAGIEVDEAVALQYYEDNKESYGAPEQRKTAHILINDDDNADATLEEIQNKLAAGESFIDLAKTYSQDPGSASSGGDLGWVSPDDMVPEFNDALFAMDVNTVSEPVKSQFGYHIIQLNEIKAPETQVFEAVKFDIIQALQARESTGLFVNEANRLAGLVLDAQSGLDQAAETMGIELKTSEMFTRNGGEDLASNPDFIAAAFSTNVKEGTLNSDIINITDTHVAFVHLNELKPAVVKPLEDVRETIVTALTEQKAAEEAQLLATNLAEQARENNQDLSELATSQNLELTTDEAVTRSGSSLPFNLVKSIFDLGRPSGNESSIHVLDGNGSDAVVLKLMSVNQADLETIEDISTESAQLTRNVKTNEQQLMIQALRQSANVVINEELLAQAGQF